MIRGNDKINTFWVGIFNRLLKQEEKALTAGDQKLSLHEIHVIAAVSSAVKSGFNTMGDISKELGITTGSLTVAARTLIHKGYLTRSKNGPDKRSVQLFPTPLAAEAESRHSRFHEQMTETLTAKLAPKELASMIKALSILDQYFGSISIDKNQIGGKP